MWARLAVVHERSLGKDSFWNPYFQLLRGNYNNIMSLTEPQMKTLLRRCVSLLSVCLCASKRIHVPHCAPDDDAAPPVRCVHATLTACTFRCCPQAWLREHIQPWSYDASHLQQLLRVLQEECRDLGARVSNPNTQPKSAHRASEVVIANRKGALCCQPSFSPGWARGQACRCPQTAVFIGEADTRGVPAVISSFRATI